VEGTASCRWGPLGTLRAPSPAAPSRALPESRDPEGPMCGIVGYVGERDAVDVLVDGLRRLEYRGYDSAGVAVLGPDGLAVRRRVGKVKALEELLRAGPVSGHIGLGHPRWATHGRPSAENAHPHVDCQAQVVVVH